MMPKRTSSTSRSARRRMERFDSSNKANALPFGVSIVRMSLSLSLSQNTNCTCIGFVSLFWVISCRSVPLGTLPLLEYRFRFTRTLSEIGSVVMPDSISNPATSTMLRPLGYAWRSHG